MTGTEMADGKEMLAASARRRPLRLLGLTALAIGGGVLAAANAYGLTQVLSGVFLHELDRAGIGQWLLALLGIAFIRAVFSWWEESMALNFAVAVMSDLRHRLVAHLLSLGPVALGDEAASRLFQVAGEGVDALEGFYAGYLPQLLRAVTVPLLLLALVTGLDGVSAAIMLITAPLIPLFMILIGHLAEARSRHQWQTLLQLGSHFYDVLAGLVTLKLFGRSREQAAVIRRLDNQFREETLAVLRIAFLSALALELLATLSTAVVAVTVGLRLLSGTLSFEQAFFVLLLAPEYYLALRLLGSQFHAGLAGRAAAVDIVRLLERTAPVTPTTAVGAPLPVSGSVAVSLRDVYYAYPEREAVLLGVNLDLAAGQRLALVGPSGAGKSTIAALLSGLMRPTAGQILVNGQPLADLDLEEWRQRLAVVSQRPHLFHRSVADNICLSRPDASRAMVMQAAREAFADDFIQELPHGYDTILSSGGGELSGGQRQRLALARVFLQDPALIILDEATRGLDLETEEQVQRALAKLLAGRTALVIAHRLSTIRQLDGIAVLADGRVVESGTHAELLQRSGVYQRLLTAYQGRSETQ